MDFFRLSHCALLWAKWAQKEPSPPNECRGFVLILF